MKVLVCGSRDWNDVDAIDRRLSGLPAEHEEITVIHGGAPGADSSAARVAAYWGFEVQEFRADWRVHGRSAGIVRNLQMLDAEPDLVIAFQRNGSRGTQSATARDPGGGAYRMRFAKAIDAYIVDMRSQGRINSPATERSYRSILDRHCDDVLNRDPHYIGREDIKRTLRRWPNPNTQRVGRAVLVSFYDWAMEEGLRKDNPARQTRRPKRRPTQVYRLTRAEAVAMLETSLGDRRERWAIFLAICAGLRNAELRGLQGRHFRRPGFVWVSADIAKGGRERWLPVLGDLEPIVHEIAWALADDEFVLPAQRFRDAPINRQKIDMHKRPSSSQALRTLVMDVAKRAGIAAHVHPHLLRHAYGDHIAKYAGMRNAQFLLGHATVATTETYVGQPSLDELAAAVAGFGFRTPVLPPEGSPPMPQEATTGIEPVQTSSREIEPNLRRWLEGLEPSIKTYMEAFSAR